MELITNDGSGGTRFGVFEADLRAGELRQNGVKVKLQNQPFQILAMLLERPGEIVTREELNARLWAADTFVDFDNGLNSAIRRLRDALGDSAENPTYVETLGRRGYRFVFPVEKLNAARLNGGNRNPGLHVADLVPALESGPRMPQTSLAQQSWKVTSAIAIAGCMALAGLLVWWAGPNRARSMRLAELQRLTVVPLTTMPGRVLSPTFSPDGSQVAFAWDGGSGGGGYDLYVKSIGSDNPHPLTHHRSAALSAAWAPDGRNIALLRVAGEEDSGIYLVPPTGGPERKLTSRAAVRSNTQISWSPDGKQLAFIDHPLTSKQQLFADETLQLFLLSLDTLERTEVQTGCISTSTPKFSPGGSYLSWVCNQGGINSSLWLLRLTDGKQTKLLSWDEGISGVAWTTDERRIVFSSWENYGAIWEVAIARPTQIERLPVGHDAFDLARKPAGPGLAYVQGTNNVNIWRLDLHASPLQVRKLVVSSRGQRAPSISPEGSKIAFESDRAGAREVWICDADGSNARQLSNFGISTTGSPRWSPDGKLIAFNTLVEGEPTIYIVDPHGGIPRKLDIDVRGNDLPSWSHDGQWIYFVNGEDAGTPTVWKVPSAGGHAIQIAARGAYFPLESPDADYVYFVRNKRLWQVKPDGSAEQLVAGMPELNSMGDEWFPSKLGIYFLAREGDRTVIKLFDVKTKQIRPVFTMDKSAPTWIGGMPVSSDGKYLLFPQVDELSSNLMLIENWQ